MKTYLMTILCVFLALLQLPGVLNGSTFSLVSMCVCFLCAVGCGILNGQTHEIKKQIGNLS